MRLLNKNPITEIVRLTICICRQGKPYERVELYGIRRKGSHLWKIHPYERVGTQNSGRHTPVSLHGGSPPPPPLPGLIPNPDKWHLILSDSEPTLFVKVADQSVFNSKNEKVLGLYFYSKLDFEFHLENYANRQAKNCMPLQGCHPSWAVNKERSL